MRGRRQLYPRLLQSLIGHILLQRAENHRADVRRCWLKEVAKDVEVILYVTQTTGAWHKLEDARQAVNKFQILTMSILATIGLVAAPNLSSHPRGGCC